MEFNVFHNKVLFTVNNDEEFSLLKKSLRIWYRDRFGGLKNHILLNFKDRSFPTGYLEVVLEKLKKREIAPKITDNRKYPSPHLFFKKKGSLPELWDHQEEALQKIQLNNVGVIESATGSGKSRIILETFLQKRVKTLIIVPTTTIQKAIRDLFYSEIGRKNVSTKTPKNSIIRDNGFEPVKKKLGSSFFEDEGSNFKEPKKKIGSSYFEDIEKVKESSPEDKYLLKKNKKALLKIKEKEKKLTEYPVTILCFQSLEECSTDFLESIECVIIDECHHASSSSIRNALLKMKKAGYRYAFSGTPWRDKKEDELLLISAIGYNKIFELDGDSAVKKGLVVPPKYEVIQSPTPDKFIRDLKDWRTVLEKGIIGNKTRNTAIVNNAISLYEEGKNVLICVDEISHLEILKDRLVEKGVTPKIVHSLLPDKEKEDAVEFISKEQGPCISIATMSVGEGADLVSVSAVILASGGKGSIRFLQRIGRGMRLSKEKETLIVRDFDDWFHPTLMKHSRMRRNIFNRIYRKST
jgi:superfamily II DNA or RNA helicase